MFHILAWLTGGGRDLNDVVFHKKKKTACHHSLLNPHFHFVLLSLKLSEDK